MYVPTPDDTRFATQAWRRESLEAAIARNSRRCAIRCKYRALCARIAVRIFDYIDAGLGDKANRVLNKCRDKVKGNR